MNESVQIGSDQGLANVVVFVRTGKLPVNDEYKKTASDKVTLDNKDCHFVPHVVGVRVGQTLELKNSDPVAHNSNIQGNLLKSNPLIPSGSTFGYANDQRRRESAGHRHLQYPRLDERLDRRATRPVFRDQRRLGTV